MPAPPPVAHHRRCRDLHHLRRLLHAQSAEEPQLHDLRLACILHRQPDPSSSNASPRISPSVTSPRRLSSPLSTSPRSSLRPRPPPLAAPPWKLRLAVLAIASALLILAVFGVRRYRQAHLAGSPNAIAVLPFDMQSKDADADYISDGIAEGINNSLARLPGLKVIPNSVASHYKGKSADFQQTGRTLDVQTILSGRAFTDRSYFLPVYLTTDSRLNPLHADPRFDNLRRRVGLPEIRHTQR